MAKSEKILHELTASTECRSFNEVPLPVRKDPAPNAASDGRAYGQEHQKNEQEHDLDVDLVLHRGTLDRCGTASLSFTTNN